MLQFAPTARLVPQLLPNANEDALAPVTAMLVIDNTAVPVFVTTTVCDAVVVPTVAEPNDKLVAESVTGGVRPVPLSATVCGEVFPLSVIVMAAVNAPVFVGAKCPWMLQLAPAARLVPQVVPITKDDAFVPVTAILLIANAAVPVLVIITVCDALADPTVVEGKVRLVADKVTGGATPVPLNATLCGELPALSVIVIAAVSEPVLVGAKCPWNVQFAPGARLDPQPFEKTKDAAFVPVTAMLEKVKVTVPVFVMIRDWDPLAIPTCTDPKLSEDAESPTGKSTSTVLLPLILEFTVSVAVTKCVPDV